MSERDGNVNGEEGSEEIVLTPAGQAEVDQLEAMRRDASDLCDRMAVRMQAANDRMACEMMEREWEAEGWS